MPFILLWLVRWSERSARSCVEVWKPGPLATGERTQPELCLLKFLCAWPMHSQAYELKITCVGRGMKTEIRMRLNATTITTSAPPLSC